MAELNTRVEKIEEQIRQIMTKLDISDDDASGKASGETLTADGKTLEVLADAGAGAGADGADGADRGGRRRRSRRGKRPRKSRRSRRH